MTNSCVCGKFHYSLDHYFAIHGDYLGKTPEHRCQVPFLPSGKILDVKKLKADEPLPILTYKWVCRHCGNLNTSDEPKSHKSNCQFVKYLAFRETEPFKGGVVSAVFEGTPEEKKKPKPKPEETVEYTLSDRDKYKISRYRDELLNILILINYDYADDGEKAEYIQKFKNEHKEKPVGWFWEELKKPDRDLFLASEWTGTFRKYAYYCNLWEEMEAGGSTVFQPEKKRRMIEWYLLSKLSYPRLEKLEGLKDKNDKPKLDPNKKYLLSELLLLIPKRKKPKPKPENAPLHNQIERFAKEYNERLVKYIDLTAPPYFPENDVDKIGKRENYWKDEINWREFLENSKDTQDQNGLYINLEKRINDLKIIFAKVVIERLIEKRQKHELESFIANYDQKPEKDVYTQEPYKTQIENVFNEVDVDPEPFLFELPKYYDELYSNHERDAEEWQFSSLTAEQWDNLDEESDLRKGIFELRNFPELKKLQIKVNRPYLGAPVIKKIDISGTADNLEELDLSQCEDVEEVIVGRKPELKKLDCRWTSLKKLNLKNTKLTPQDYDTLNFPIRMKAGLISPPAREQGETEAEYNEKLYRTGEIIWPFEHFTGDQNLITLLRANIIFNIPWIKYARDWSNIDQQFKKQPEYIQSWYDNKFDYETAKDWMNIFDPHNKERIKKARFCAWCRDVKKKNAEWVLNHNNQDGVNLEEEFNKAERERERERETI